MKPIDKILKYSYLGNVYPECDYGWYDLLIQQLEKIDDLLYSKYTPTFIKRMWHWLHYKSPYMIRCYFQFNYGYSISQIKEKYGRLRIYNAPSKIYDETLDLSWGICERCGSNKQMGTTEGYITRMCKSCSLKQNLIWNEDK